MTETQLTLLLYSLAYSLPTVSLFYLIVYATGSAILKSPHRVARGTIGFVITWLAIGFILPFKTVKHYEENMNELFFIAFVVSVLVTFVVCKLGAATSQQGVTSITPTPLSINNSDEASAQSSKSERIGWLSRLNGWQRLGIVFSAMWIISVFAYGMNDCTFVGCSISRFVSIIFGPVIVVWAVGYAARWVWAGFIR